MIPQVADHQSPANQQRSVRAGPSSYGQTQLAARLSHSGSPSPLASSECALVADRYGRLPNSLFAAFVNCPTTHTDSADPIQSGREQSSLHPVASSGASEAPPKRYLSSTKNLSTHTMPKPVIIAATSTTGESVN